MYIPLYNKSNYTLLSSLLKIDDIINYAISNNMQSIAISDNNMFATMEFIKKCTSKKIKPIIGLEINLLDFNLILYAKNYQGYQSLIKLSTIQSEREVDLNDLKKYNNQVIAVLEYKFAKKYKIIEEIYKTLYLGYKDKTEEEEAKIITKNIVFFRESLYLEKQNAEILNYLYLIRDGKTILDDIKYEIEDFALNIPNILTLSSQEGLISTKKIANQCNLEFPSWKNLLPIYECENPSKYLFELCKVGLTKRLNGSVSKKYIERLLYELKVINKMGFSNYFLIVYDFVKFAKKNKILVGPGRGSAAGSLVAYSLGITDIDPLKYDLLFERFLNPARKTMPDIDIDFPDNKRDIIIDYVKKKYGEKRVSGIITFGTMATKQVIRDVSRVLNIPLYKVDSLCKFIPTLYKENLQSLYEKNASFKARIDNDTLLSNMFQIATKLEGFPRHTSSHAAGIIMSQVDLDEVVPLTKTEDLYLTSFSMEYLEELGLLKMDFLVLKNLTLIDNILNDIKTQTNENLDFNKIPMEDQETLSLFENANTCGIFQFESNGMRKFLKKLKPKTFDDIFAAIALFRPGAAVNIDTYIRRKNNEEEIKYLDPSLEEITKNTYGILIYQEQIMQVAKVYANYSLGEADILRRAMSKKKLDLLKAEEEKFIFKSIKNNHNKENAKKLFNLILNFAGFGFNKSHSVVYSIIAYKMAYLKCHYKNIFFANLLTNVIGIESKTSEYILEARANQIEIEKPSINHSDIKYIVKDNKIIFPLSNIKSIGTVVSNQIINAKIDGHFQDIYDCFSRLYIKGLGKKTFEVLIYADVFKEFNFNRATLISNLDSLYNYAELTKDIDPSLVIQPEIELKKEFSQSFILEKEKEVFGFYLSSHHVTMFKKDNTLCIPINTINSYFNKIIDTIILVEKIKVITTKKGDKMAFVTGSDETGSCEFTIFPRLFKDNQTLEKGNIIKIRGNVEKRLNELQIIAEKINYLQGEINEE